MRSLLVKRLCMRKQLALRHFSASPVCHIIGAEPCGTSSRDGAIGKLVISDYTNPEYQKTVLNKKVPMDLVKEMGTIGASHGWVATLKQGIVCLQDDLNPGASDKNPKRISLPPLETLPHCQTQVVTNIAMSSSSPEYENCIVAVKFLGPQLSLCRPQEENEWVNIRITDPGFFSSQVMYSRRDKMFSMPAAGGTYIKSWDLEKYRHTPKMQALTFLNLPEFVQSQWAELDCCCTSEYLVESRTTGETFLVKRFRERNSKYGGNLEEKQMMVFKLCENGVAMYTEDIGDLCIFLSKSEAFCIPAKLHDDCSNCVHFMDNNECGAFMMEFMSKFSTFNNRPVPYFIPPQF